MWVKASPGNTLRFAIDPVNYNNLTQEQKINAAWLGGVFDGEGCFSKNGSLAIAQSRGHNPDVHKRIGEVLDSLGFDYRVDEKGYFITGGFRVIARFLILCRPIRRRKMESYLFGQVLSQRDRVASVSDIGEHEVVSLTTTTGNYVAWGYLSKNCDRYTQIVDWEKHPAKFRPNVSQNIILDLWAESEKAGEAILMMQLKGRRLGVSTLSELAIQHRFQFKPYSTCVIASSAPEKTAQMAAIIKYCYEQHPWWLLPQETHRIYKGIPVEFPDMNSTLTIQAGNQLSGLARGSSPNIAHLSEVSEWRNARELIEGALLPAILDTQDVFFIMESTAKGPGYWKEKWEQVKRDWPRGRSRIRGAFLPWFVGTDIFPTEADLRKRPIPPDWIPQDRTIAHAERARQYVTTDPLLFKYLAKGSKDWQMPKEQMWWWEAQYDQAKEDRDTATFLSEYPSDDFEAFQYSNIPVIDPEILVGYQRRARPPLGAYTVIGPDIPQALVTPRRYWDESKPTITIATRPLMHRFDVKYQLVPVKLDGYPSTFDEDLKLLIWEWPIDGHAYGVGTDAAMGIGADNAVIEVLRESTPTREPGQVAEWVSNQVTAFQMWPIVMAVACLYSTVSNGMERRQAKMAIEAQTNGSVIQHEMKKRGWVNFHARQYNDKRRMLPEANVGSMGVIMNAWFRENMIDMLLTALAEESIDLPSQYLVNELVTLERSGSKAAAASDCHDDRVIGIGLPLFSLHINKPPTRQYARQRVQYQPGLQEEGVAHPIWTPPEQASSVAFSGRVTQRMYRNTSGGALQRVVNNSLPRGFR
jgi:hypothetical protein